MSVSSGDVTVADALRRFAPDYIAKYRKRMPPHHRKVLGLIIRCKTGELGNLVYQCDSCQQSHWVGRSCGNRHCPNCQKENTQAWLEKQTSKLLPVQHFVVTFTVPSELWPLLRAHPKSGYEAIFNAGQKTIRRLLEKPKNLGSKELGFFGVLHTWGRDPKDYNPHVHFVVPGGGISPDGSSWIQAKQDHLFHPTPARQLYKKLFADEMKKQGLYYKMPYGVLKLNWVVNRKPVGDGQAVLKYLAPYVYRVAISDNRVKAVTDNGVTYLVKPSGKQFYKTKQLAGHSFVRAFAQHILPPGFQKVRYYGFMSPNCKRKLAMVRWLVWLWLGWNFYLASQLVPQTKPREPKRPQCPNCQREMQLLAITSPDHRLIWVTSTTVRGPPVNSEPDRQVTSRHLTEAHS